MNIDQTVEFFSESLDSAQNKAERKIYERSIAILVSLKSKDLSEEQMSMINDKLTELAFDKDEVNPKKYRQKQFNKLTQFLTAQFSFIIAGHSTVIFMILGMTIGTSFGMMAGVISGEPQGIGIGMSMGTGLGMSLGIVFGSLREKDARKKGMILETKLPGS